MHRKLVLIQIFFILLTLSTTITASAQSGSSVLSFRLEGTITNTTYEDLLDAVKSAEERGQILLLLIDTPGGLLDATFNVIELIESSNVPIVGYVYPAGGKAWSAGTFILMATHVAVMAPNTIIGSAQPVAFDPASGGSTPVNDPKTINALSKYIEERAKRHGRSEDVASRFVTENLNLDDEEALNASVIELRARDIDDLLLKMDGMQVEVAGKAVKFETAQALVSEWSPSLGIRLLGFLSNPLLAYLMFILGFYSLFFGLSTPGLGAEVLGGLLIILGLIGLGVLGINLGAVVLISIGFILLIAEIFIPGFGILGITGLVCVFLGGLFLFPREWTIQPEFLRSLLVALIVVPVALGIFFIFVIYKIIKARRMKPYMKSLIGEDAEAMGDVTEDGGFVRVQGEIWRARSGTFIKNGSRVKILDKEGSILIVTPIKEE